MNWWIVPMLFALLTVSNAVNIFTRYNDDDARRIEDELVRLGATPPEHPRRQSPDPASLLDPVVSSPAGDFEGYWTKTQFGRPIAAFEGIPYVKAPVGPLRFKVAEPLPRLKYIKAKQPGPMCLQRNIFIQSPHIEGQEDCLTINIYVPENMSRSETDLLPVMVWIHGGGFLAGSGAVYQPHILLDQDVVLVTFNYRLTILGFLSTDDGVIPGNLGMKDQVAALRWVHDNIEAFGGNPNLVTVFGQSAGGACTEYHMLSPLSRGLFHRAISISGSVLASWALAPLGETRRHRQRAAKHLGCPHEPSEDLLACLNTKTGEELARVDKAFVEGITSPIMPFKPIVEGDVPGAFLPDHPEKIYSGGGNADVPWMFGMTEEEGGIVALNVFTNSTYLEALNDKFHEIIPVVLPSRETLMADLSIALTESVRRAYFPPGPIQQTNVGQYINLITDYMFLEPMLQSKKLRNRVSQSPTYAWLFSYVASRSFTRLFGDPDSYGTCHGDDILFLFPLKALGFGEPAPEEVFMSMVWSQLYANFARFGVPSSTLLKTEWKPIMTSEVTDMEYLHIESPNKISMKYGLFPERWQYFQTLYKTLKIGSSISKDEL